MHLEKNGEKAYRNYDDKHRSEKYISKTKKLVLTSNDPKGSLIWICKKNCLRGKRLVPDYNSRALASEKKRKKVERSLELVELMLCDWLEAVA